MHGGVKHPVFYASKKLIPREQNYSVGEREALAIIWAVKKFHRYLYGQHFTLESDCYDYGYGGFNYDLSLNMALFELPHSLYCMINEPTQR